MDALVAICTKMALQMDEMARALGFICLHLRCMIDCFSIPNPWSILICPQADNS